MPDSAHPEFWDSRFRSGTTPWDAHGVPLALAQWIEARASPLRVLIPGCGSGYEVRLFAAHGHDVLAIDFSDAAIEAARRNLGPLGDRVRKADFFELQAAPFDLVYERAFLCALPRPLWAGWGRRTAELVRPGGLLAGFFFLDDNAKGPPFGTSREQLSALLAEFELQEDCAIPATQSLPVFRGREIWQAWKRRL